MDWNTKMLPVLRAVHEIEEETNAGASLDEVAAKVELEPPEADRRLGALADDGWVEGPRIEQRAGPIENRLTAKAHRVISSWPRGEGSGPVFNISASTINQLAGRDIHNETTTTVNAFFDAWERAVDELPASDDDKTAARELLSRAREVLLATGTGAAGSLVATGLAHLAHLGSG